jgi:hypothetical protein
MSELTSSCRRWLEADEAGQDDAADEAFGQLFREAAADEPVSLTFASRTMEAIAAEALRTRQRAERTRRVAAIAATLGLIAAGYVTAGVVLPAFGTALVALSNLVVGAMVRTAAGVQAGADLWSLLGSLGHAASAFVANPKVTFVLLVLQGFAIAALVALQRLLGSDGESWP